MRTCDIKRVVNCRKLGIMLVDSDHYPVKNRLTRPAPRRDWSMLWGSSDDAARERAAFTGRVLRHYRDTAPAPTGRATRARTATTRTRFDHTTHKRVSARVDANSARSRRLTAALKFASESLPRRPKPSPDWFTAAPGLRSLIDKRNQAQRAYAFFKS